MFTEKTWQQLLSYYLESRGINESRLTESQKRSYETAMMICIRKCNAINYKELLDHNPRLPDNSAKFYPITQEDIEDEELKCFHYVYTFARIGGDAEKAIAEMKPRTDERNAEKGPRYITDEELIAIAAKLSDLAQRRK